MFECGGNYCMSKRFIVFFILLLYMPITTYAQSSAIVELRWLIFGKETQSLNNVTYTSSFNYTITSISNSSMLDVSVYSYTIDNVLYNKRFFRCNFFAVYMFNISAAERYFSLDITNNDSNSAIVYLDIYDSFNISVITIYQNRTIYNNNTITKIETVYKDRYLITLEQAIAVAIGGICIAAVYFHSKINKGRRLKETSLDELWDEVLERKRR